MLRTVKATVEIRQEKAGNRRKEMKILRKNQEEMLDIEKTITEMKDALNGLISRPDTGEKELVKLKNNEASLKRLYLL